MPTTKLRAPPLDFQTFLFTALMCIYLMYRTRSIISRACIFFTPCFSAVYNQERLILDNLCTKQGNMSLKSAVYNQEQVIMACVYGE